MQGTTANLRTGDNITVKDLLFGLMLPSGNDAAQSLAEFFGWFLAVDAGGDPTSRLDRYFIREMNDLAGKLGLKHTFFRNAHGMFPNQNVSTAENINRLAAVAMESALFRSVVSTVQHKALICNSQGESHLLTWNNTNKLLNQGFEGVKTGYTAHAGPCLCVSLKYAATRIIITVLGARDMEERWREVPRLARWALLAAAKLQ
jgi:D-alanyl-D-alanine carboxypeptidase